MQGCLICRQTGNCTFVVVGLCVETDGPLITQEIPLILLNLGLIFMFQRVCNQTVPTTFHFVSLLSLLLPRYTYVFL